MRRTYLFAITIIAVTVGSIIVFFGIASLQNNPWDGLSCEEMFDFAMSPEHQKITMEQHMEFHKDYDPCIQNLK